MARTTLLLLLGSGCGASSTSSEGTAERPAADEVELPESVRRAYLSENSEALRQLLGGERLAPEIRMALEESAVLRSGPCRIEQLDAILAQAPSWIAELERADCAAESGDERAALEHFVWAVDLCSHPDEVDYVVRRTCRAADTTGLEVLCEMCTGHLQ